MTTALRPTEELQALAAAVVEQAGEGAEALVVETDTALTRFASNAIHQNVADTRLVARLRLIRDGRVAVASAEGNAAVDAASLVAAAERALDTLPKGDPSPLPHPADIPQDAPVAFSEATAAATATARAEGVARIVDAAKARSLLAYGALSTITECRVLANSTGLNRAASTTSANAVAVVRGDDGSGYAERHHVDVGSLDVEGLAHEVVDTCTRNQKAQAAEPGQMTVVLGPYAVAEMLEHLSYLGLSGLAVEEERSFMRPGEKLMDERITLVDDAASIHPFPFDYEGVATRKVTFIEAGVCRDVVHDSDTARRAGVASTGHALPMPNTWGPYPTHLGLDAGDASVEELVGDIEDGLFVTRFWYVRDVHPLRTVITGMTRDGTFRIRDGKLADPVRDLRFTQSIVEALHNLRGLGANRLLLMPEEGSAVLVPHLSVDRFTFSS